MMFWLGSLEEAVVIRVSIYATRKRRQQKYSKILINTQPYLEYENQIREYMYTKKSCRSVWRFRDIIKFQLN